METNNIKKENTQIEELTTIEVIKKLQHKTENIRNICVLAHVDHGKTSLVDNLISYNNIINPRLAGDIRYMDSRPDEQERCITMKSSSISVAYSSKVHNDDYLINLIDSPGHVDFSSEIFSALKICDGALILIDVVEGICSQTESVIKQAWDEKIKCVLVLNKIDRLITELQLDPLDAYVHIDMLLEKANSLIGSLIVRDINVKNENELNRKTSIENEKGEIDMDFLIEQQEKEIYFSPEKGNVIFASAYDCWAFTLNTFAEILNKKLGFKKEAITKLLWGDYYFNVKTKKVHKEPVNQNSKPMFVEFILDNIYKLYKMVFTEKNAEKIQKAAVALNCQVSEKEMNMLDKNPRALLKTIIRQWLPVSQTVYDCVITQLPNPMKGLENKMDVLFPHYKLNYHEYPFLDELKHYLKNINSTLNNNSAEIDNVAIPNIAFVSKMISVPRKNIGGQFFISGEDKDEVKFCAFARTYFGTFKKGQEYFVIGPKHDPKKNYYSINKIKFDNLYLFMGQYLEPLETVPAGNIFSISGLENFVYKTATISSVFDCPSIIPSNINKNSIIKVSILPEDIKDMQVLIEGLKKLNKSDPAVDYYVQSNGEHILVTSGEVHLERCIKDLEDQLAKVKLKFSAPIVNFKEGLSNINYNPKRIKENENKTKKPDQKSDKERKKDLNKGYVLDEGEENIDVDNQDEILKSSMPMVIVKEVSAKKPPEKEVKHKIKDFKSKIDKKDFFIEKNLTKKELKEDNSKARAYAEDITPNKLCKIGVNAIGMTREIIDFIEAHEVFLKEINSRNYIVNKELFEQFCKFKTDFINVVENKRLKTLIENNLFCLGSNGYGPNMLIIKNISPANCFFNQIQLEKEEEDDNNLDKEIVAQTPDTTTMTNEKEVKIIIEEEKSISIKDSISNILSRSTTNKEKDKKSQNTKTNVDSEKEKLIDEAISAQLKGQITPREFLTSVKSGYELAILSGPLCEENMYGVIFIIEEIKINRHIAKETDEDSTNNNAKQDTEKETTNSVKTGNSGKVKTENTTDKVTDNNVVALEGDLKTDLENQSIKEEAKNDEVRDASSVTSKQYNLYGPFLGQVIGTVKDCCRQAFLNGDPRLYEALYLCIFQIRQEHIGKIHSVINKRRGNITKELSNDDVTICTIEATIPVAESFGFVEEIRKKSSGMANPMLTFYKWEIIDVDPFYTPVSQEVKIFI